MCCICDFLKTYLNHVLFYLNAEKSVVTATCTTFSSVHKKYLFEKKEEGGISTIEHTPVTVFYTIALKSWPCDDNNATVYRGKD